MPRGMLGMDPGGRRWQWEVRTCDHTCAPPGEDCQEPRDPVRLLHPWDGDVPVYAAEEPPTAL